MSEETINHQIRVEDKVRPTELFVRTHYGKEVLKEFGDEPLTVDMVTNTHDVGRMIAFKRGGKNGEKIRNTFFGYDTNFRFWPARWFTLVRE